MSDCQIDIRIGSNETLSKDLYKHIEVSFELQQEKLAKLSSNLCNILSKTVVPFIVVEHPEGASQDSSFFAFKEKQYDVSFHTHGGKLYQYANPKQKEAIKLIKNIQKQFQKISKLNNQAQLKLSLYDPLRQEQPQDRTSMLNGMRIKGSLGTDKQLIASLSQIIRRISIQFLNSPIMAFAQLLQQLAFKVQLAPLQEFPPQLKASFLSYLDYSDWISKQKLSQLHKLKGDIVVHISLPKLLSIRIKVEASVLAAYASIFINP